MGTFNPNYVYAEVDLLVEQYQRGHIYKDDFIYLMNQYATDRLIEFFEQNLSRRNNYINI